MRPFVIDVYRVDSKTKVSKKRFEADSLEEAIMKMDYNSELADVNRIVISRRLGGGGLSTMRVWTRMMAS